jgi:hypothetical protein
LDHPSRVHVDDGDAHRVRQRRGGSVAAAEPIPLTPLTDVTSLQATVVLEVDGSVDGTPTQERGAPAGQLRSACLRLRAVQAAVTPARLGR